MRKENKKSFCLAVLSHPRIIGATVACALNLLRHRRPRVKCLLLSVYVTQFPSALCPRHGIPIRIIGGREYESDTAMPIKMTRTVLLGSIVRRESR